MDETLRGKINLLIHLANADGHFDVKEKAFIYNVCLRKGVDLDTIGDMIEKPEPIIELANLPVAVRIDYLVDCLLLIQIDGVLLPREVSFLYQIGKQLGFPEGLISTLVAEMSNQSTTTYDALHRRVHHLLKPLL